MTSAAPPRIACADLPALPLQLLLRRRPDWMGHPMAVVAEDTPRGLVLFAAAAARRAGVRTGMRYGAALALAPELRADVVEDGEIAAGVSDLTERLLAFTPGVEPSAEEPGVFFLDASGLARLHDSPGTWAAALADALAAAGFRARIAVGFTRFGVYAAARTARGVVVFPTEEEEVRAAHGVALARLAVAPALCETLAKLGVRTAGDLVRLPEEGLSRRFGEDALRLRRMAAGDRAAPLDRALPAEPLEETALLEHPETDAARLLFLAKRRVDRLVARAASRREAVAGIALRLVLERHPPLEENVRTAAPTLDAAQIADLVRLRLAALRLASGVVEMTISAAASPATEEQLELFAERPRRDDAAAERAFARLAAEFGDDAVVVARLREAHLPEAAFAWEPASRVPPPRPLPAPDPPLVRRLLARPRALPPRPSHEPDGWLVDGPADGPVVRLAGPYVVAGGWWSGTEVRREVVFAETARGRLLWAFFDTGRRQWFVQGVIE